MVRKKDTVDEFCKLVTLINEKNDFLDKAANDFYDGGTPFNEVYADDINEHKENKQELRMLISRMTSPPVFR